MSFLACVSSARRRPRRGQYFPPRFSAWRYLQISATDGTDYSSPSFDDTGWTIGAAPFGDSSDGGGSVSGSNLPSGFDNRFTDTFATTWAIHTRLWIRRTLELSEVPSGGLRFRGWLDDNCHFYINGALAFSTPVDVFGYGFDAIIPSSSLVIGTNSIAVRCDDEFGTGGNTYFDFLLDT